MNPKIKIALFVAALALLWLGLTAAAFDRGVKAWQRQSTPIADERLLYRHAYALEVIAGGRFDVIERTELSNLLIMLIQIKQRGLDVQQESALAETIIRRAAEIRAIGEDRLEALNFDPQWRDALRQELALLGKEGES